MNRIKLFRGKAGLTQVELAKKIGVTKTSMFMYESSSRVQPRTMQKISEALGNCTAFELYGDDILYVKPNNDKETLSSIILLARKLQDEGLKETLINLCSKKN